MSALLEGTPISLIIKSAVTWEVAFEIFPIRIGHALRIAELIAADEYFNGIDVSIICEAEEVTGIVFKSDQIRANLAEFTFAGEWRVNEIIDAYLDANGGYAAAQA